MTAASKRITTRQRAAVALAQRVGDLWANPSRPLSDEERAECASMWEALKAEADFVCAGPAELDSLYRTAAALVRAPELEPGTVADALRAYAVALGIAEPDREVERALSAAAAGLV